MPGMNSGLNTGNPLLISAFRSALLHQGLIALLVLAVLAMALVSLRETQLPLPGRAGQPGTGTAEAGATKTGRAVAARGVTMRVLRRRLAASQAAGRAAEPSWRMLLRVGFGLLWIFDGLLQAQPAMAVGLPAQVITPGAASSPPWVQHLVNWAGTTWSYHPVQAAAAAVWIQVGIGCWLVAAPARPVVAAGGAGRRWAGAWWCGSSVRRSAGSSRPGLTWLFGAPGRGAALQRGRGADRAARAALARTAAGPGRAGRCSGRSSPGWPCCRRGRAAGSGRAAAHGRRAR